MDTTACYFEGKEHVVYYDGVAVHHGNKRMKYIVDAVISVMEWYWKVHGI